MPELALLETLRKLSQSVSKSQHRLKHSICIVAHLSTICTPSDDLVDPEMDREELILFPLLLGFHENVEHEEETEHVAV